MYDTEANINRIKKNEKNYPEKTVASHIFKILTTTGRNLNLKRLYL